MSRMGKVFELVLMAIFAGFATYIISDLIVCFFSLVGLGRLRRGIGSEPCESGGQQTTDQQRSNGFVRRQLSALALSLEDDYRRLTRNRRWCCLSVLTA